MSATVPLSDRVRALIQVRPHMVEHPVDADQLFWQQAGSSLFACVTALFLGPFILFLAPRPFLRAHLSGARHRWEALCVAIIVGVPAGVLVGLVFFDGKWSWSVGVAVGTLVAVPPYARITQVEGGRAAPAGSPGPPAPG